LTTAPPAFGLGAAMPSETTRVTGRRIITTIIDGLSKAAAIVDSLLGEAVAYIAVLVSDQRQRLGDMAAHTLVVRIKRVPQ
jgi:uncharacterized RDD family membrane protein YckC